MKVTVKHIIYRLIISACVISMGVLYIFVPYSKEVHNFVKLFVLILGLLSYCLTLKSGQYCNDKRLRFANKYTIMVISIVVFFIVRTSFLYKYNVTTSFMQAVPYLNIIFAVPIAGLLDDKRYSKKFRKQIIIITIIFLIIRFISWVCTNFLGIGFLGNFASEFEGWSRGGKQRYIYGSIFGAGFVFFIQQILSPNILKMETNTPLLNTNNKRNKFLDFLLIIFILFYSIFVTQLRYNSMILLLTLIATIYFTRRKNISRLSFVIFVIIAVTISVVGGLMGDYLDSFKEGGLYANSTMIRFAALDQFINYFKSVGKYIGLGFPVNNYGTEYLFYRNSWKSYFIDDLGIFDPMVRFGFFFIPIYIVPFFKSIKIWISYAVNQTNTLDRASSAIITPVCMYMILSCLVQNIYIIQNSLSVPFYIAIISIMGYHESNKESVLIEAE